MSGIKFATVHVILHVIKTTRPDLKGGQLTRELNRVLDLLGFAEDSLGKDTEIQEAIAQMCLPEADDPIEVDTSAFDTSHLETPEQCYAAATALFALANYCLDLAKAKTEHPLTQPISEQ